MTHSPNSTHDIQGVYGRKIFTRRRGPAVSAVILALVSLAATVADWTLAFTVAGWLGQPTFASVTLIFLPALLLASLAVAIVAASLARPRATAVVAVIIAGVALLIHGLLAGSLGIAFTDPGSSPSHTSRVSDR